MADSERAAAGKRYVARLKEARIGDMEAQYDVALMCANGVGVVQDLAQAIAWARSAAERGHAAAQYLLGTSYSNGVGVPRELRSATRWLTRAAEQGHERAAFKMARILAGESQALANEWQEQAAEKGLPEAQMALADQLLAQAGDEGDATASQYWYEKAAQRGYGPAQLALARMEELGRCGPPDAVRARELYRAAARQGIPAAQIALTHMDAMGSGRTGHGGPKRPTKERRTSPKRWVQYAQRGGAEDAFDLARMFENGWGIQPSLEQARDWYAQAAAAGHAEAQLALARLVMAEGGSASAQEAGSLLLQSARQGQAQAQHALARTLAARASRDADWLEVFEWCAKAAAANHAVANRDLAELLMQRAEPIARAAQLRAASHGSPEAQYAMGRRLATGDGVPTNMEEACRWYLTAPEHGSVEAEFELAVALLNGQGLRKDEQRALLLLERAARQGHAAAQWRLGELYASGATGLEPDARRAAALCRKAAQAGFAPAQATLAVIHAKAGNHAKAIPWWEKAHAGGDLESTLNLAHACHAGRGLPRDLSRAFALWLNAAEAGLGVAANRVGLCYATGDGVALDAIEAARWFISAGELGDPSAESNRKRSRAMLSAIQWAEAERRAAAWQTSHANNRRNPALIKL